MHNETYPGKSPLGDDIELPSGGVKPFRLAGAAREYGQLETGCGCGGFLARGEFSLVI